MLIMILILLFIVGKYIRTFYFKKSSSFENYRRRENAKAVVE